MGTRPVHTPAYRKLCKQLAALRTDAGFTIRSFAERIRKPHSYVFKVEHGERRIDPVEFVQWCSACGADPAEQIRSVSR